jgi:hypothetical protein
MKDIYGIPEILAACELRTAVKFKGMGMDQSLDESIVITKEEYPLIYDFLQEGAAVISSWASFVRNGNQTGIEAITFSCCDDDDPDTGTLIVKGQKLSATKPANLVIAIETLDKKYNQRLTIVQTFIRSALISYILYKWYKMKGASKEANDEYVEHEEFLSKVRFNAVANAASIGTRRKPRYF